MIRGRIRSAVVVIVAVVGVAVLPPAAAHAAGPTGKGWDGISPTDSRASVCQRRSDGSSAVSTPTSAEIKVNGSRTGKIELRYSSTCRTVWGRVLVYTIPSEGDAAVYRYNDSASTQVCIDEITWSDVVGAYTCFTPMVYDGGYVAQAVGTIVLPNVGAGYAYTGWY
ncbi:DUF2690 domain-containing protein [Catellatospora bangladeshensis]|uniref:DUF2690 domain-containing protein n=1 Tax=Catellatospora bangladeshensis TaxID=310355 RepID=A0A8J3JLI5_9ACTN|nr:DUF2690 domain-containing protein [Catellatospora bangladeshensis]GIF82838.1 hypothetical protein Cba03nite_41870 [Catellatospora bangladeshensis]